MELLVSIIAMVIVLVGVIIYQGFFIRNLTKFYEEREKDLMDRVMSRNYESFVQAGVIREELKKSLTAEEIAEMQQERGIPV